MWIIEVFSRCWGGRRNWRGRFKIAFERRFLSEPQQFRGL